MKAWMDPKDWQPMYLSESYDYSVIEGVEIAKVKLLPGHVMVRWLHKEETKGNIILPQNRQRAHFMKGEVLCLAPDCAPLVKGQHIEFDGLCEKVFIGSQQPNDRDVVFVMRIERIYGTVRYEDGKPTLDMIRDHILLRPDPHPTELAGLIVTESTGENMRRRARAWVGEVIRTGERVESCQPGDRIAYATSYAAPLKMGDHNAETCIIIQDMDVLADFKKAEVA